MGECDNYVICHCITVLVVIPGVCTVFSLIIEYLNQTSPGGGVDSSKFGTTYSTTSDLLRQKIFNLKVFGCPSAPEN